MTGSSEPTVHGTAVKTTDWTPLPFIALVLGAIAMGTSPIFVRLADVGPYASAFWRMALALPVLWGWLQAERTRHGAEYSEIILARDGVLIWWIGFFFAGDLFFWHLSIMNTTIANSTLLATTTPIIVVLGAWLFLKERVTRKIVAGVILGLAGAVLLIGVNMRFAPDRLLGDVSGLITACFFGCYFLSVARARQWLSVAQVMFYPALVTCAILFLIAFALEDHLLPQTWAGLAVLAALAFVSQLGGQGLAAYALGHLPAVFSSLVLFFEVIAAGLLAWLVFTEPVSLWQLTGGILILAGIYAARPERRRHG